MNRREMLRNSTFAACGLVTGCRFSWEGSKESSALLLEAAQFQDRGGWGLDSQFMDIMGSGFLIAHGIGKPVKDAVATIQLPETGSYRIWVRTRDWVAPWKKPGTPESKRAHGTPGIFQVKVNGKIVGTFGNENDQWHWQDGGFIRINKESSQIVLHDLTGFVGRCAGIFLTRDKDLIPPDGGGKLAAFRRKWHRYGEDPKDAGRYDFIVIGGGVAGLCAAIKAAREGVKVALIQDRPMVGGNNSSEIRMWLSGTGRSEYAPKLGDILAEFDVPNEQRPEVFPRGRPMHNAEGFKDDLKNAMARSEYSLSFFPMFRMNKLEMNKGRIAAVVAESISSSERLRFRGDYFADCTGDGCVGYLAGADFELSKGEHMGRSNQWSVTNIGIPTTFPRCPWAIDLSDKPFPGRTEEERTGSLGLSILGNWNWESGFGHDPITMGEYIRDWNLRAMYGAWDCIKNVEKGCPTHELDWAAFIAGMRESRRLIGDLILNEADVCNPNWYDDGIVPTGWKIDVHYPHPKYDVGFEGDAFISTVDFKECVRPYYIPYRCFYSRNIGNLFMAGRDISVTRQALGTVRVQRTTALMGEVVGMAVAICVLRQCDPRDVYHKHLAQLKIGFGMDPDVIAKTEILPFIVLNPGAARRAEGSTAKYAFNELPEPLQAMQCLVVSRGDMKAPAKGFSFRISAPATVYIAVHDRGEFVPPDDWKPADMRTVWSNNLSDTVYLKEFDPGVVEIPGHEGMQGGNYGLPHAVFVPPGISVSL